MLEVILGGGEFKKKKKGAYSKVAIRNTQTLVNGNWFFTVFNIQTGGIFQSVAFKFTWYHSVPFAYSCPEIILYIVSE